MLLHILNKRRYPQPQELYHRAVREGTKFCIYPKNIMTIPFVGWNSEITILDSQIWVNTGERIILSRIDTLGYFWKLHELILICWSIWESIFPHQWHIYWILWHTCIPLWTNFTFSSWVSGALNKILDHLSPTSSLNDTLPVCSLCLEIQEMLLSLYNRYSIQEHSNWI